MFILLFVLWIIFNGRLTGEVAVVGLLMSLMVTVFVKKFFFKENRNFKHLVKEDLMTIAYFAVLIVEIIKANIMVLSILLSKEIDIEPCFCYFTTDLKNPIHRILLANSITLTPGTITVELNEKGQYKVHCLDKTLADGINESIFVKMLKKMEEG
ncbi:MAG: Na+/H+ antiporter subunit E [Lachnospiraceae bacterium]|nr:Na+/H+ antiporter subunit E [Lachnospiraceae bacterium]